MKQRVISLVVLFLLLPLPLLAQDGYTNHSIKVTLVPAMHGLTVVDTITLPKDSSQELTFLLHSGLRPISPTPVVRIKKRGEQKGPVPLELWSVSLPPGLLTFTLTYEGVIYHSPTQQDKDQARGFPDSPGTISPEGVFLSATSAWYPDLGPRLLTFDMEVKLPADWDAVSQGERTQHDRGGNIAYVHWRSPEPQEQIFLVANRFLEYAKPSAHATAMVFLRSPDAGLANKYLDATTRYLDLYSKLIGPYPYKKFALVENIWETGYGMPSFTLLGPKVIRLPFIINTSYPHEILHNWWGNSVYPDFEHGNWSEGLTAFLADLLMKEQQGGGPEYRMTTLQKYADYVQDNKDFPLTQFHSRHSASTEAIGYGKGLMFFNMLRRELGDETFKQGLREFYKDYQFQFASWSNIRLAFETASGKDLERVFDQWVSWTGAPELRISAPHALMQAGKHVLTARLEQTQSGKAYRLLVPIAVTLEGRERAYQTTVAMNEMSTTLTITLPAKPLRLDVDPEFDLFRRLSREETPPAISQAFGDRNMLVILPELADAKLLKAYRAFAKVLRNSGPDRVTVKFDTDVDDLPDDRAVVLLGWENRFYKEAAASLSAYDVAFKPGSIRISQSTLPGKDHAFVFATRLSQSSDHALLFIAADRPAALAGLGQKLPHYHKYSYLAFAGQEPANVAKGRWPVNDSPMTVFLPDAKGGTNRTEMAGLAPREPLARLAPVFSKERMMDTVRFLSSDELAGRGFGSPGLDKAADYIAAQFKEAGLAPGGDLEGSWFQTWEDTGNEPAVKAVMKNVVAVIPGKDPKRKEQSVVIAAHYDHLGLGWPESRNQAKGRIHPGADDNASGVAVLIELARAMAREPRPDRSIVFIAFTGEEAGKRGSKYYVEHAKRFPADQCIGMVNLDTVGRLGKKKLLVLGAASAREWVHIFRGAGFVTGVDIETVSEEIDSSDQKSFQETGVPAVQLFSGPHFDYHRTTDTADKIDPLGLEKVAAVAKETVGYLAGREIPLTTGTKAALSTGPASTNVRRVSLGTIPDFAYQGKGVRLSGVMPDSPALTAGLQEGDVIVRLNNTVVQNLSDFSAMLKALNPGDKVSIIFLRAEQEMTVETVVKEK